MLGSLKVALSGAVPVAALDRLDHSTRLKAAVTWIETAIEGAGDGGVSKGYDVLRGRWNESYPETTGYTIPTLLNAADLEGYGPRLRSTAIGLSDYLLSRCSAEGGIVHWSGKYADPVVFDTGQVLFGWIAAHEATGDARPLDAARRAGDWLASVQDESGSWKRFQHLGVEKVIDTRVAWALLLLHRHTGAEAHRAAALRNLDWALTQQDSDGWFRSCAFTAGADPFTHTLAYTAEGLFECGLLLDRPAYIEASRRTALALLARQRENGSLASTYGPGWKGTSRSSCLTGNCQMARLWLSFHELDGAASMRQGAERAIACVAAAQPLEPDRNLYGGIAGSSPIYGKYERFQYPNWAAKFFLDALLTLEHGRRNLKYRG